VDLFVVDTIPDYELLEIKRLIAHCEEEPKS
jgi:hypothetical protein